MLFILMNIVIIGAGPAGLSAAKLLAKKGKKVIVLEKEKAFGKKICAGGLCRKDFKHLPKNIADKRFYQINITTPNKSYTLKTNYPIISTITREKLGKYLAKQAGDAGVVIKKGAFVKKIDDTFVYYNGKKIRYDILIGADGPNSVVRKYLGLNSCKVGMGIQYKVRKIFRELEVIFDAKQFGIHYAWIFPQNGFSYVGAGSAPNLIKVKDLKKNLQNFLRSKKIRFGEKDFEAFSIRAGYSGHEFGNIYLAGEAAGLAMEISGQGIYQAIVSGKEIARKILNKNYDYPELKKILRLKKMQAKALMFLGFLYKINPWLCQKYMNHIQDSLKNNKKRWYILKGLNLD